MKYLSVFLCLLFCSFSYGQREKIAQLEHFDKSPIRYGYYIGLHYKGYHVQAKNASINAGGGFQLGVLAEWNFSRFTSLMAQPGVLSSSNDLNLAGEKIQMPTTYFHFPVSIKFATKRINNTSAFIATGASYNFNFTTERNNKDNGAQPNDFVLTKHNVMGELTFGFNFYFPFFKFSPSIKGIYGFNNEFKGLGSAAKESLSQLKSRAILVTFIFQ